MKICPKCGSTHNKSGVFCCRSCANSRTWSSVDKDKKSRSAKDYLAKLSPEELKIVKARLTENAQKLLKNRKSKKGLAYILDTNFDDMSWQSKRKRIILEQDLKCLSCGLSEWQGQAITLEIDHIDGNRFNNCRDNLRALCPNCHSLTPTWRGKKNSTKLRGSYEPFF